MDFKSDEVLDCFGLMCPMPIIETSRKIKEMDRGQVLEIHATDKGILHDMPAWCRQTGQEYLGDHREGDLFIVYVRKLK
jgi:tRNA 2-thiouridine synthesizing protein A